MKNVRDEACGSQVKRSFGSSSWEESKEEANLATGAVAGAEGGGVGNGTQKLTTNDALTYLKEVKEMFQDQREKYDTFLEVMKDFKAQRTDTAGVIARVKELFKGHNNLIYGFNTFLPKGYEITLDEDDSPPKKTVEFEEAISFVNKIKKRFQHDEHVYKSFLDILNMYRKERKDISEVYREVATLFENHQDLLEEFTRFLPDTSAAPMAQQGPTGSNQALHYNGWSSGPAMLRQMHTDKQCHQDRKTFQGDCILSIGQHESEGDKSMPNVLKNLMKHHHSEKRKPIRNVEGFCAQSSHVACDDKGVYQQAFVFCDKVKQRLSNQDDYQAFLKCLDIFSNGIIKRNDLQNLVTDLLGKHPDLMVDFNQFVEHCENIDGFLSGIMSKKSLHGDGTIAIRMEDRERDCRHGVEGSKEKERCKEKYMWKSIQELDLSNCERCTPSYRLLPDDYPIHSASQRSELGTEVLNDHWVSVTSGSEDYSFKHMRKNQYEESLFRCEDDRFELDLLLESVSSTAKRAEDLLKGINENKVKKNMPIHIDDHFTAINLRCIERLYGDHGLDVVDIFRKSPAIALPVIMSRLKQKYDEWLKCRGDLNKIWADVYEKNHYKSLDHRSFYFKQQDPKNFNGKALVAEINELKVKLQKEDDVLLSVATGYRQPITPHMEYEYSDASIHADLYALVYFSCEEMCSTKDQLDKILRLWTTFLEPMLGFCRSEDANDVEELRSSKFDHVKTVADYSQFEIVGDGGEDAYHAHSGKNGIDESDNRAGKENSMNAECVFRDDGLQQELNIVENHRKPESYCQSICEQVANVSVLHCRSAEKSSWQPETGLISGYSNTQSRFSGGLSDDDMRRRDCIKTGPSPKGVGKSSAMAMENGIVGGRERNREAIQLPEIGKEDRELSPNSGLKEEILGGCKDTDVKLTSPLHLESSQYRLDGEGELTSMGNRLESIANADDKIVNPPDAGNNGSGSDSTADELSHEKRQEREGNKDNKERVDSESVANSHEVKSDAMLLLNSNHILASTKPLAKHVQILEKKKNYSRVFFGNDDFYVLFRLHQILYERILSAKKECVSSGSKRRSSKDIKIVDGYGRFMRALYCLLDGSEDNMTFEDECHSLIGNHSYTLFTLDKLIYRLIKQLQAMVAEDTDIKLLRLYDYERSRKAGRIIDAVYYENARVLIHEDNIYRLEFSCSPSRMSIQLMDNVIEKPEAFAVTMDPIFSNYLHDDFVSVFANEEVVHDVLLRRNKRKYVGLDEYGAICKAIDDATLINGLECKISCKTYKTSYVLDTEDIFYRKKRRVSWQGRWSCDRNKVERFHKLLARRE